MREKVVTRIEPNVTIIPKLEPMAWRKRVAAYARVSAASDEQMGSIDAQRDYYSKYIAGNTQWDLWAYMLMRVFRELPVKDALLSNR